MLGHQPAQLGSQNGCGLAHAEVHSATSLLNMLILTTLLVAQAEGCCILGDRRDVSGVAEWIDRERVAVWNGVPAQLYDLVHRPDLDISGLEEAWCGGGACPDELRQSFEEAHLVPVRATYGLTEAPTVVAIDPADGRTRPGAAGQVLPTSMLRRTTTPGGGCRPDRRESCALAPAASGKAEVDLRHLESLCRQRVARYKVPDFWSVVEAFPTNAMGKIIRTSLPGLLKGMTGS